MSFLLTTPQVLDRTKRVTRRVGWQFLKGGDLVQAVERARGVPRDRLHRLAVLRIVDVRVEPLRRLLDDPQYGNAEVALEGFANHPQWGTPAAFVEFFTRTHHCTADDDVTRIEFAYVDNPAGAPARSRGTRPTS